MLVESKHSRWVGRSADCLPIW